MVTPYAPLNSWSERQLRASLEHYPTTLERFRDDPDESNTHSARITRYARWSAWEKIAFCKAALRFPVEEVRAAFAGAAREYAAFFDICCRQRELVREQSRKRVERKSLSDGTVFEEHTIPFSMANSSDYYAGVYASVFGAEWESRRRLLDLTQEEYHDPAEGPESNVILLRAEILRSLLRGLNPEAKGLLTRLDELERQPDEMKSILPGPLTAHNFRSVLARDTVALETGLLQELERHEDEAKRGYLNKDVRGLFDVHALMLARLALERGLRLDIDNPYLPLAIIDYPTTPGEVPSGPPPPWPSNPGRPAVPPLRGSPRAHRPRRPGRPPAPRPPRAPPTRRPPTSG